MRASIVFSANWHASSVYQMIEEKMDGRLGYEKRERSGQAISATGVRAKGSWGSGQISHKNRM
jgi:hypothetical protein